MFTHRRAGRCLSAIALALWLAGTGCQPKALPPFQAPAARLTLSHFAGGPLTGPTTRSIQVSDPTNTFLLNVRLIALEQTPASILRSIEPDVRLIAVSRGGVPVVPTSRLTQRCRWDVGEAAAQIDANLASAALGRNAEMASYEIAVPTGACASILAADQTSPTPHSVQIVLQRPAATTQPQLAIALTIEADVAVEARAESAEAATRPESAKAQPLPPPRLEHLRELAMLRPVTVTGPTAVAVLIPFPTTTNKNMAVLALLNVSPGSAEPRMTEALARAVADAKGQGSAGANQVVVIPPDFNQWPGLKAILDGSLDPNYRRASLAYAAAQTRSEICQDVVLVADDAVLNQLIDLVQKRLAVPGSPPTNESIQWGLDSAAVQLLSMLQSENRLSPELYSVLLRHTGEAGANAGSVDEILEAASSSSDFAARLQAENLVYLEDASPGARVRAYDWLTLHGRALEGYDPLGPPRARRDALQKIWDAMNSRNAVEGGKP